MPQGDATYGSVQNTFVNKDSPGNFDLNNSGNLCPSCSGCEGINGHSDNGAVNSIGADARGVSVRYINTRKLFDTLSHHLTTLNKPLLIEMAMIMSNILSKTVISSASYSTEMVIELLSLNIIQFQSLR